MLMLHSDNVWRETEIEAAPELPEFTFSGKTPQHPFKNFFEWPDEADAPFQGPIRVGRTKVRSVNSPGKADPIWGTQFTTKFSRKPQAELVTPKGKAEVFARFLERASGINEEQELAFLVATQHLDIATTLEEFKANSIAFTRLDSDDDESSKEFCEGDTVDGIVFTPSPTHIAAMSRTIEWERYRTCNGEGKIGHGWSKCFWSITDKGTVGIEYRGTLRIAVEILNAKREFKYQWIARFGAMPTVEEVSNMRAASRELHGSIVPAYMDDAAMQEDMDSRKGLLEDHDLYRDAFHASDDPKPVYADYEDNWPTFHDPSDCDVKGQVACGRHQFQEDLANWTYRESARNLANSRPDGYAGPSGILGLVEDAE